MDIQLDKLEKEIESVLKKQLLDEEKQLRDEKIKWMDEKLKWMDGKKRLDEKETTREKLQGEGMCLVFLENSYVIHTLYYTF